MRIAWLAAVLSISLPRAFADIVCDTKWALGIKDADTANNINDAITPCIQSFCTTGLGNGGTAAHRCGSVLLIVTQLHGGTPAHKDGCIAQLNKIIQQCFVTAGDLRGTAVTDETLYEAHITGKENRLEARRATTGSNTKPRTGTGARTQRGRGRDKNRIPKPQNARKTKSTKSRKTNCSPKKPKRVVRDVLRDFVLTHLLRRTPPPSPSASGSKDEACKLPSPPFRMKKIDEAVTRFGFVTSDGWDSIVKDKNALEVMRVMNSNGVLSVVKLEGSKTYCVADESGVSDRAVMTVQAAKDGRKCLITNGNYFVVGKAHTLTWYEGGKDAKDYDGYAVGFTTTTPKSIDVHPQYVQYFRRFEGDDGTTSMTCGPDLKEQLDLTRPELNYWCQRTEQTGKDAMTHPHSKDLVRNTWARLPGSLAHAGEKNERLVTVIMTDTVKYVFSYTCDREDGVDLNKMREIIDTFLNKFEGSKIDDAKQALNFDGGGSLFMAWVYDGKVSLIAAGDIQGQDPYEVGRKVWNKRFVQTMVRHDILPPE